MTKGFITIATGKEEYYQLAYNLLRSYRYFTKEPLPFAILADRENGYTKEFDDVIIFPNGASNSYLDKLELARYAPYDVTMFIDADCLAYGDLSRLFDYFREADDFSCFGRVLPLDGKTGWFEYENLGALQEKVSYIVGLHGGIYCLRKTQEALRTMESAKELVADYTKYKFKGKFDTPGDEPLVALAMALHNMHPVPFVREAICCYWEYVGAVKMDISKGVAYVKDQPARPLTLLHWGTRYTRETEYRREVALLSILEENSAAKLRIFGCKAKYGCKQMLVRIQRFAKRAWNKLLRVTRIKR